MSRIKHNREAFPEINVSTHNRRLYRGLAINSETGRLLSRPTKKVQITLAVNFINLLIAHGKDWRGLVLTGGMAPWVHMLLTSVFMTRFAGEKMLLYSGGGTFGVTKLYVDEAVAATTATVRGQQQLPFVIFEPSRGTYPYVHRCR